jgi:hypothetical protein
MTIRGRSRGRRTPRRDRPENRPPRHPSPTLLETTAGRGPGPRPGCKVGQPTRQVRALRQAQGVLSLPKDEHPRGELNRSRHKRHLQQPIPRTATSREHRLRRRGATTGGQRPETRRWPCRRRMRPRRSGRARQTCRCCADRRRHRRPLHRHRLRQGGCGPARGTHRPSRARRHQARLLRLRHRVSRETTVEVVAELLRGRETPDGHVRINPHNLA